MTSLPQAAFEEASSAKIAYNMMNDNFDTQPLPLEQRSSSSPWDSLSLNRSMVSATLAGSTACEVAPIDDAVYDDDELSAVVSSFFNPANPGFTDFSFSFDESFHECNKQPDVSLPTVNLASSKKPDIMASSSYVIDNGLLEPSPISSCPSVLPVLSQGSGSFNSATSSTKVVHTQSPVVVDFFPNNVPSSCSNSPMATVSPTTSSHEGDADHHDDDDHSWNATSAPTTNNKNARFKAFHEEKWSQRYDELKMFVQEHQHAAVPHTYPRNPQLARWVKRQRRQYKLLQERQSSSTLTPDRLEMLNSVGFVWDSHEVNWSEKVAALVNFKRLNGHCNVPSNHSDKRLATWVKCQRRQYKLYKQKKSSAMSAVRIQQLETIGFEWEIRMASGSSKA